MNTNTKYGYQTLNVNTGNNNSAFGYKAGLAITTGTFNTNIGSQCGNIISTGFQNTLIGSNAGNNGGTAGRGLTTGTNNTIIGSSGAYDTYPSTGSGNTMIGYNTKALVECSNSVAIGTLATIRGSNEIAMGTINETTKIEGNIIIGGNIMIGIPSFGGINLFRKHSIAGAFLWDTSSRAYPIFSTISDYPTYGMNDIDDFYTVGVGYKLVVYQASAFGL